MPNESSQGSPGGSNNGNNSNNNNNNNNNNSTYGSSSSRTTRSEQAENEEHDDNHGQNSSNNKSQQSGNKKTQEKSKFKGTIEGMNGHVFQLFEESKKANQFSNTLLALETYSNIELERPHDMASFFKNPMADPVFVHPDLEPPSVGSGKANRDSYGYIQWKLHCEEHVKRMDQLHVNKTKLFSVITSQCSTGMKPLIEATLSEINRCISILTKRIESV